MPGLDLSGRVALVTGAGSGIGRAAAGLFAAHGASLVCVDVSPGVGEVAAGIRERGGEAEPVVADVSRAADVEAAVRAAETRYGGLDVLFNNAGLWLISPAGYVPGETDGPSPLLTEDVWQRTIDVNLKGVYLGCRFGIPAMRRRGGGAIVNVASIAAFRVGGGASDAYTAAKGGVVAITRTLAVEHAPEGIRVNCVVPGPIRTAMVEGWPEENRSAVSALVPLGRWGEPEEVAWLALFLASDAASFCTGGCYAVDGGYLAL